MTFFSLFVILSVSGYELVGAVRPAYENDPDLCPFTNKLSINSVPSQMTPRSSGKKYFYRVNASIEVVTLDKALSVCRMYHLEAAEVLDQDDYDEITKIVQETGWSFWLAIKGKFMPKFGNFHFDFTLLDSRATKIPFHDFVAESFDTTTTQMFEKFQEGCVAVMPDTSQPSGVSWAKVACNDVFDILCQYKKSCYKRSDYVKDPTRPIKRLIPLGEKGEEDSGYAISTMQATWPFAKQVCEDADMSLIWFDGDAELGAFQNRMNLFSKGKAKYDGKSFWTAGRFSPSSANAEIYDKLYWWEQNTAHEVPSWDLSMARSGQTEHSGDFFKQWGKEREATHLEKNEPYDEGARGIERCVDASFSGDHAEYFTSKCEKRLRYFICRDASIVKQALGQVESPKPSFIEYCTGDNYHKLRERDCTGEVIFAGQTKPECTCYSGIHGLMADIKCKPRLLVGSGCTKLKAKSSLHWKILPGHISHGDRPWIITVHSTSGDQQENYNWFSVNVQDSGGERQLLGGATFYFAGYDLYGEPNARNQREICLVRNSTKGVDHFYEYQVEETSSLKMRYYNYDEADCGLDQIHNLVAHQVAVGKNDCELGPCQRKEVESLEPKKYLGKDGVLVVEGEEKDTPAPSPDGPPKSKECSGAGDDDSCTEEDIHDKEPGGKKGKAEGEIEDVNDNVNRQLLIYAIESVFPDFSGLAESGATAAFRNTWLILEKLFELAKHTCSKMVKAEFLSRILKYFQMAHSGESYSYGEYFSEPEMRQISTLLDSCQQRIRSRKELEVQADPCSGKAWRVTLEKNTKEVISRSTDTTGYQSVFHHHIMEATWDVIDLWNALCVNEFKSSYLLYHHMEQGLETLFTDKLKKLWHFPNVSEDYFEKLLGPDEGIQLINLDQCVLAAYNGNGRMSRMGRPNRGRNAVIGQMIRTRLEDEKLKSNGVPPTRNSVNGTQSGSVSTACIRGSSIRCHKKPSKKDKNKRNNKMQTILVDLIKKEEVE